MPEVTDADLGDDYWATSPDVQAEFNIEVRNTEPDHERRIDQATRSMQARWAEATGTEPTDANLPDTVPPLLRDATAYLAASKAHLAYAQNVQGSNNDDNRHIFLEQQADEAFEDWKRKEDLTSGSETSGEAGETVSGFSGVIGGKANSPIHRGN